MVDKICMYFESDPNRLNADEASPANCRDERMRRATLEILEDAQDSFARFALDLSSSSTKRNVPETRTKLQGGIPVETPTDTQWKQRMGEEVGPDGVSAKVLGLGGAMSSSSATSDSSESSSDSNSNSSSDSSSESSSDSETSDSHIRSGIGLDSLGAEQPSKPVSFVVRLGPWNLESIREEDTDEDMEETEAAIRLQRWFRKMRHELVVDEFDEVAAPLHCVSLDSSQSRLHAPIFDMCDEAIQEYMDFHMDLGDILDEREHISSANPDLPQPCFPVSCLELHDQPHYHEWSLNFEMQDERIATPKFDTSKFVATGRSPVPESRQEAWSWITSWTCASCSSTQSVLPAHLESI